MCDINKRCGIPVIATDIKLFLMTMQSIGMINSMAASAIRD